MLGTLDNALNVFLISTISIVMLTIVVRYFVNAYFRVQNSKWVINKLMNQYNYDMDLCRRLVIQADNISKCRLLGRDKEKFLVTVKELILKTSGDMLLE